MKVLRVKREKKRGGRRASYVEVGGCKVRPSGDGSKILIEGLTKEARRIIGGD
jgi:hypothetical protein